MGNHKSLYLCSWGGKISQRLLISGLRPGSKGLSGSVLCVPQLGDEGWLKVGVLYSTPSAAYGCHVFSMGLWPATVLTAHLARDLISQENKPDRVGEAISGVEV